MNNEFQEKDDALKKNALPREEVVSHLEAQINQNCYDLEHTLLPRLGHSEAKRLLLAAMKYPMLDKAFTVATDGEDMVRAYSACKAVSDSLVALGVETVIEQMVKNQMNEQTEQKEKSNG